MAAAVAHPHAPIHSMPSTAVSDGGGESPIFYPLDTPNAGVVKAEGEISTLSRHGSVDDGYRRFVRASSDPAGATPAGKESGKLDNEPNPFEVSFKNPNEPRQRRARSQSPKSAKATPLIPGTASKLPSLQAMASPSPTHGTGISHYAWNIDSLRSGPLSPSMLSGPTSHNGIFDPASMRTGLTPQIGGHSWGPDTPGTAAFFASLTSHTPGISTTLEHPGATAPVHRDGPNHFEATFARAMSQPDGVGGLQAVLNSGSFSTQSMPRPMPAAGYIPTTAGTRLSNTFDGNGLHLLSHGVSQHELGNDGDDTFMAAAALSNLQTTPLATYRDAPTSTAPGNVNGGVEAIDDTSGPGLGQNLKTRGAASNSVAAASAADASSPDTTWGRKRKNTAENGGKVAKPRTSAKKAKATFEDDDDAFDEDDDIYLEDGDNKPNLSRGGRGNKKHETDEDKRRAFLERNRQAALKCRQRKKAWLQSLQSKVEYLTADNETLQSTVNSLREEIAALRAVLVAHKDCPVQMPNGGPHSTVGAMLQQHPSHMHAFSSR